jgi:hypothetical protein
MQDGVHAHTLAAGGTAAAFKSQQRRQLGIFFCFVERERGSGTRGFFFQTD